MTANGARIWYHFDGDAELECTGQIVSPTRSDFPRGRPGCIEVELPG
ncbi:MAG: hypothetical protein R3E96_06230 [Planctomycetota bacterium]